MHDAFKLPEPLGLFSEKLFYKIGEVGRIVGVEPYVLRYWETEFPFIQPKKSKSGQRVYTRKDIDLIILIKKLLYEEKYTIDGVRRRLGGNAEDAATAALSEASSETSEGKIPQTTVKTAAILGTVKMRLRRILSQYFGA